LKRIVEGQRRALDAMSGLLNSLLDISKLDAGLVVPSRRHFSVDEVLEHVRSNFEAQAHEKSLELEVKLTDEAAYTDSALLQQVLFNLVANAVRYTRQGGINVSCERHGSKLRFEVADTGIGIPQEEIDRIFDEFYQADQGTQRPDGLGLGLSIVQRLAALLEYDVSVESAPSRGTIFRVLVPAGKVLERAEHNVPSPVAPPGTRVLIIDDEPEVAEATRLLLEIEGFETGIVGSTRDAIEHVRELPPDIIVSDYHLRAGETGVGVVVEIRRELRNEVPVVFVTGDTASPAGDHGIENAELLTKPMHDDELLEAIRRRLAAR
jgi:CheY-like chemotaxis protein/anti-sigma regulatory factor (Ser/Thr protein kinase)